MAAGARLGPVPEDRSPCPPRRLKNHSLKLVSRRGGKLRAAKVLDTMQVFHLISSFVDEVRPAPSPCLPPRSVVAPRPAPRPAPLSCHPLLLLLRHRLPSSPPGLLPPQLRVHLLQVGHARGRLVAPGPPRLPLPSPPSSLSRPVPPDPSTLTPPALPPDFHLPSPARPRRASSPRGSSTRCTCCASCCRPRSTRISGLARRTCSGCCCARRASTSTCSPTSSSSEPTSRWVAASACFVAASAFFPLLRCARSRDLRCARSRRDVGFSFSAAPC